MWRYGEMAVLSPKEAESLRLAEWRGARLDRAESDAMDAAGWLSLRMHLREHLESMSRAEREEFLLGGAWREWLDNHPAKLPV